ncbi:hypothetical protein TraAM80_05070 [Trypanosoma rangeli]|uniref:Uncharacterized protein n=1 Tax=Trypanosoma rangeli TaxID=5698 RepID=A0A3R7MFH0_TRYRA|nr:uncharacterized protein TraAM80_05070 [Trypanosoma rangeli]RNF04869.1 hypothetical protein TraAM80_05070 [Trypanosoma rangeli]|eukprot:RNF04869.1 hypothetical protein TraAM80_05070 [Trypanosoma rangeli]
MLTALHITLPQRRDRESEQHLPNRCLIVNELTCEASLISTEASLKYARDAAHESYETGTRFRFGHITISPHHGSIFVTQVAPLLYDLCRGFFLSTSSNDAEMQSRLLASTNPVAADSDEPVIFQRRGLENASASEHQKICQKTWLMSRTVFIYGSRSATERRALFLHLAKAVALALLQETNATETQTSEKNTCEVCFSLVDLYHAWGVGDVLDPNAVMHDSFQLQRLKREEPRRSLNEPKGIDFVEPTRQLLEGRDSISTCLLRALQRIDSPRALRTSAEREDHAVKSTLVLTFTISKHPKQGLGASRRGKMRSARAGEERGRQKADSSLEARFHIILLPDSAAAAHGKQAAQELGALANALQACTQWQNEIVSATDAEEDPREQRAKEPPKPALSLNVSSSGTTSTTNKVSWVPLRESPLLLYLFESNIYYRHQLERSLRNLRLSKERRRQFSSESRSVGANVSTQSQNAARSVSCTASTSMEHSGCWMSAEAKNTNVLDCIAAGIGQCLLIVCVNSGWDQYYQARSAFLFAQRASNQLSQPCVFSDPTLEHVSPTCGTEHGISNFHKTLTLTSTRIQSLCQYSLERQRHEPFHALEETVDGVERQLWSSPERRETTEPRHPKAEEFSVSPLAPSEVAFVEEEGSDQYNGRDVLSRQTDVQAVRQPVGSRVDAVTKITSPIAPSSGRNMRSVPMRQLRRCDYDDQQGGISSLHDESTAKSWEQPEIPCGTETSPLDSGLCESPTSAKGVKLGPSPVAGGPMIHDVLLEQSRLRQENAQLRVLLASMSSQQADSDRELRGSVRIADICDAALLESRRSARLSEIDVLRKELATTTKKAQVLQKTLLRSVDDNRKLRRAMHAQMKQLVVDLPRIFQDTLAERDSNTPAVAEERLLRWEMLLENTVGRMMRPVSGDDHVEGEKEQEQKEESTCTERDGRFGLQTCQIENVTKTSHANCACAHMPEGRGPGSRCNGSCYQVQREANDLLNEEANRWDWKASKRDMKGEVKSPLGNDIDFQVAQLLQLAYRLFLCGSAFANEVEDDDGHTVSAGSIHEGPDRAEVEVCGAMRRSLSKSVLDIMSPHQKGLRAKAAKAEGEGHLFTGEGREPELCWKCHMSWRPCCNAEYTRFLEILRSLCGQLMITGTVALDSHRQVMYKAEAAQEELKDKKGTPLPRHVCFPSGCCPSHESWGDVSSAELLPNEGDFIAEDTSTI